MGSARTTNGGRGRAWRFGLATALLAGGTQQLFGCGGVRGPDQEPTTSGIMVGDESGGANPGGSDDAADDGGGHGKFDVAQGDTDGLPDGGGCNGGGPGEGEVELSYIWIANSAEGTISKLDTQSLQEHGRYRTKSLEGYPDPSRTSVNLRGDVAVANRNGGVAKFFANPEHCTESNGAPGIQTSSSASDVLAWEADECLAWNTPLTCSSNRPVAWTRGEWNAASCSYAGAKLWTVCDADVLLLDGETGAIEETIAIGSGGGGGGGGGNFPDDDYSTFIYGGAADADGNFWGLDMGVQYRLLRVDRESFEVESWPLPSQGGYGITVGPEGRPWVCGGGGVARFDPDTASWQETGHSGIGGCMTDGEGVIWHSDESASSLVGFDLETLDKVHDIPLPEYVHGISVDFHGYVWGVSFGGNNAYRVDPTTGAVETYSGLNGAYTYSDMTGFALETAGGFLPEG